MNEGPGEAKVEECYSEDEASGIETDPSVVTESAISLPGGLQKRRGVQTGPELLQALIEREKTRAVQTGACINVGVQTDKSKG